MKMQNKIKISCFEKSCMLLKRKQKEIEILEKWFYFWDFETWYLS